MDRKFLHPKDRNQKVKLGYVRDYAAAQARNIADDKEAKLRAGAKHYVALGYRLEELALVEQTHPSLNPLLDKVEVGVVFPLWPFTLWVRRTWRRFVWPYRYSVKADRSKSKVRDGQS